MIRPQHLNDELWLQTHLGHDRELNDTLRARYYNVCYISASPSDFGECVQVGVQYKCVCERSF